LIASWEHATNKLPSHDDDTEEQSAEMDLLAEDLLATLSRAFQIFIDKSSKYGNVLADIKVCLNYEDVTIGFVLIMIITTARIRPAN
jgi:hypothetical protein